MNKVRAKLLASDNYSIDSKDSCKPEKCDSPSKPKRRSMQRNGQGTSQEHREGVPLGTHVANLRTITEGPADDQ